MQNAQVLPDSDFFFHFAIAEMLDFTENDLSSLE